MQIQKIVPCLWFNDQAEEAVEFYTSIFPDSRITRVAHYGKEGQEVHAHPTGSVMTVAFQLNGISFTALNGGPDFKFNEAISLQVLCETQDEIDRLWEQLSDGGDAAAQQCGWLKDKFGLSWQIIPAVLPELLSNGDPKKSGRVMGAVLRMKKLDIAELQQASAAAQT